MPKDRRENYDDCEDGSSEGISQPVGMNMLQMTAELVPAFSGRDNTYPVARWIDDVESNAEIFGWSPLQQLLVARRSLTGTALLWLQAERPFRSWEELKAALLREFPDAIDAKTVHELMSARVKKVSETCLDYMLVMKELGKRGKMPDYVAIKYIVDGIIDVETNKMMLYGVTTYSDLKDKLKIYEQVRAKVQNVTRSCNVDKDGSSVSRKHVMRRIRCYGCGELGHASKECPHKSKGLKCFKCNAFGHVGSTCNRGNRATTSTEATVGRNRKSSEIVGNAHRQSEHDGVTKRAMFSATHLNATDVTPMSDTCVSASSGKMAENVYDSDSDGEPSVVMNVHKEIVTKIERPIKLVSINNMTVSALVDSGSDVNLISSECFSELGLKNFDKSSSITMSGLGYCKVKSSGVCVVKVCVDENVYNDILFHVVPSHCMPYQLILGNEFLKKVVTVMKGSLVWVCPSPEWLGEINCIACVTDCLGHVTDQAVRDKVMRMVNSYKPCQIREAPIELKIILKDDIPVAQRPRRISPMEQVEVDKQVREWLGDGIIRVSYSEYASPLVLVKKKDGSIRICVDYRQINKKMVRDEYPLPNIDDHIDKLASAQVFSALDLKNGYFHLRIQDESIKYTAFVTMTGQYEFLRAPFGLATCPKVFTRFITIIFRDLIARGIIIVFIDDILIPAADEVQAVERLQEVLKVASEHGLQINWTKSQLLTRRVEYLGHVIEDGAVMPSPGKTDAVIKFPEPQNLKQLHSFLGLCSYFRKFIPEYALIARPLTDMLRKDHKFQFDDEHRAVFDLLKTKLATKPVLKIYDQRAETELHTDASSVAYSAILMQKSDDGELHPIHYMSRRTSNAESRYTSYELEALAIIEGVKKFRHYLFGKPFKIVTDCKAFEMTLNKKDLAMSTRVARWILLLQDYDFTIEHRSGTQMKHTDALSRNPQVALVTSKLHDDMRRAQETDEGLRAIIEILKRGEPFDNYYLLQDLLYKGQEQQLVVPAKMEVEIIRRAHENGHFAKKKTLELISKDYYISDLGGKVESYLKTCIPCLLASKKVGKQEGFLSCIDKGDMPLHTLHLDHVGPLTETRKLYNHILTIVDAFTKFVWLFPTKTTATKEVLSKLEVHRQIFGNPERIISDRGSAFTSNDFKQYCEEERIQHITITTGVPRGNGQVKRMHRTIISVLTKLCIENPELWYKHVSRVQTALNSTFQRSIGTTPFELLVGRKMRKREDVEIYELLQVEQTENYAQHREELRKQAKQQLSEVQQENKKNFDKNRRESRKYAEGELVAIKRTQFGTALKLKPKYLGPHRVTKVKRCDRYDVEKADPSVEGPNKTSTAADHMKSWPQ